MKDEFRGDYPDKFNWPLFVFIIITAGVALLVKYF
jgi:hypothetical protein